MFNEQLHPRARGRFAPKGGVLDISHEISKVRNGDRHEGNSAMAGILARSDHDLARIHPDQLAELHRHLAARNTMAADRIAKVRHAQGATPTTERRSPDRAGSGAASNAVASVGSDKLGNRRVKGTPEQELVRGERNARMASVNGEHAVGDLVKLKAGAFPGASIARYKGQTGTVVGHHPQGARVDFGDGRENIIGHKLLRGA